MATLVTGSGDITPMSDEDEASERQYEEQALVDEFVKGRLEGAERAYSQGLTSLWLGNGAAALAVLGLIGATWREGKFPHQVLCPLSCFVLGLVSLGIGTGLYLWTEGAIVNSMETATSWRQFPAFKSKSPTARAGLTLKDPRTIAAMLSAVLFVAGCVVGLLQLWASN